MPEGKSHQDSKLHALRTGAARAALASAAIAKKRGKPAPVIQPTGLHWERHYWFRTKSYVEYIDPIEIKLVYDDDKSSRLEEGEWIEPPVSAVNELKQEMYLKLSPLTPGAPDWKTYRAWKLIAHLKANHDEKPLTSLSQEVHATRRIRDEINESDKYLELIPYAADAAEMLHSHDLDANCINHNQILKKMSFSTFFSAFIGIFLMTLSSIPAIIGSGIQSLLARYMAEGSDEGLDARTTYFFLAGMFSPVIFWPIISLILIPILDINFFSLQGILSFVLIIFVFYLSSLIFLLGYDHWSKFRKIAKISSFSKSSIGEDFKILIEKLNTQLGPLK